MRQSCFRNITVRVGSLSAGVAVFLSAGVAAATSSEEPAGQRIDRRFAADQTDQAPDFRRHVIPLIGRLGCNGRACHGSFQGQGDFRLSLFGYDFQADLDNLASGDHPRVDPADPDSSLVLLKPLEEIPHEGGRRLERDSWQHRVLRAWIAGGAHDAGASGAAFVRLEVEPSEIVAAASGTQVALRAVAVWSDGTREDVTPLCRFESNDDQVATVDVDGLVTAVGPGDSHVVAFYDNGVVPVPVILPVSEQTGAAYPAVPTPTRIDELVVAKLRKVGIVPSKPCTDAEFLRRVSLDMTGSLPTVAEAEAFLADRRRDKRALKVEELLERPAYASWWATRLCDWTGNNARLGQQQGPDRLGVAAAGWYEWMRARVAENMPYDQIVERIVLARSRLDGESYRDYCRRMSEYQRPGSGSSFADHPMLPAFWSRQNFRTTEERALGFAHAFLGVRIQCAQCHKHPFDQWTKDDFERFENFFTRVRFGQGPGSKQVADRMLSELGIDQELRGNRLYRELAQRVRDGAVVPFGETYLLPPPRMRAEQVARIAAADKPRDRQRLKYLTGRTATVLGGQALELDALDDPRTALMEWMRDDDNPYFARALVNRVWAGYFNVGIVEPPDDLSLANPPSNEPLLEHLADGFRARGYDLQWLHREIANSRTYQSSWRPNGTNRLDQHNFSRAVPRRIPAEPLVDAVRLATASDEEAARLQVEMRERSIADPIAPARGGADYVLGVFGRSTRESNCDCDRSSEPGLLQAVFLQNDVEMLSMIDRRGGWVDRVSAFDRAGSGLRDQAVARQRGVEFRIDALQRELAEARQERDFERAKLLTRRLAALRRQAAGLSPSTAATPSEVPPSATPVPPSPERETRFRKAVEQAYLRTLTRRPTAGETSRAVSYLHETGDFRTAVRDVLWALLNSQEFVVNH
jgi:hypothetical protein